MKINLRSLCLALFCLVGMVSASQALTGCIPQQGGYYNPMMSYAPIVANNGVYGQQNIGGYNSTSIATAPTVAANEANLFVGNDPMFGSRTAGMTLVLRHEADQSSDRPIWYRVCIGAVCTQPSADGMPLGAPTTNESWVGLIPPHRFQGNDRQERTGMIRPGNNINVDIECFTGADARALISIGGWSVPGGINIPGRFQANIVLAERYCYH